MWSKQLIELLLSQYEQHENLYNVRHRDYNKRDKRTKSLLEISQCLKNVDCNITVDAIKSKIHILRAQFTKEAREIAASKKIGLGRYETYKPKLWSYPLMGFLKYHIYSRPSCSSSNKYIGNDRAGVKRFKEFKYDDFSNDSQESLRDSLYLNKRKSPSILSEQIDTFKKGINKYDWLGKQVLFELDIIKDQDIRRETAWKIQTILREANIAFHEAMTQNSTSKMTNAVLCRTCGENIYNLNPKNLFDSENCGILVNIGKLTGIWLDEDQDMPMHICACCYSDLNHSIAFRERCIKTHKLLQDARLSESMILDPLNTTEAIDTASIIKCKQQEQREFSCRKSKHSSDKFSPQCTHKIIKYSKQSELLHSPKHKVSAVNTETASEQHFTSNLNSSCTTTLSVQESNRASKDINRTFICDQCGKSFADSSNLKLHIIRHTGVKDFECMECGRKYITQHLLNLHVRVRHEGEMPYACKYCEQRFFTSTSRCRHERVKHTKKLIYACRLCGKTYSTKSYLNRHEFLHTGERPHRCDICDVAFPRNTNLKIHYRSKNHQKKAAELQITVDIEQHDDDIGFDDNIEEFDDARIH